MMRVSHVAILALVIGGTAGCSAIKAHYAANYGIGVSSDRWIGVYQLPIEGQVGTVMAEIHKFADSIESTFVFKNETLGLEGSGTFQGQVRGREVSMLGQVQDAIQGTTFISMEGSIRDDVMEGSFSQRSGEVVFNGRFALVRLTHTTYLGGIPRHQVSKAGQAVIDLGAASPGLLGPGRPDVYGPGIHSDSTGRPFAWRTDAGQIAFGRIKANAYGLGVGMDQFGRPVRAKPLW